MLVSSDRSTKFNSFLAEDLSPSASKKLVTESDGRRETKMDLDRQQGKKSPCEVARDALERLTPLNVQASKSHQQKNKKRRKATHKHTNQSVSAAAPEACPQKKKNAVPAELFTFSNAHLQLSEQGVKEGQRFRYRVAPAWMAPAPQEPAVTPPTSHQKTSAWDWAYPPKHPRKGHGG